ncbi:MAG: ABC transporter substrate-binding protein [Hyphomicrobiales bacterium]|nr:ABC transporter substrate-binding protein [Hyphomicrobiales bacterium]
MTRKASLILGLAATLLGFVAQPALAQEEIVIGATVPITGNFAATGINYYNSLRMAQDDINAAGGIKGKKINIVFEDTQSTNSTAVNALVKLVRQTKPPLIFLNSLSVQILAQEQEIAKAGVPVLYSGALVALHEKKNPMMFRIRPADDLQAAILAKGIDEVIKAKKPAIIHMQDEYGAGTAKLLEAELAKRNLSFVAKETFSPRDNDFSAQLLNIKNSGADAVICVTYNRDGGLIMKQRRALGIETPFLCTTAMFSATTLELVEPDDLKNVYAAGDVVLETRNDRSKDFVKRYAERWGFKPDPYGAAYYDAMFMVADAIGKVGSDPVKLQEYFANLTPYEGTAQRYLNQKNGTNNLAHSVVLVKFKAGTKDFEQVTSFSAAGN